MSCSRPKSLFYAVRDYLGVTSENFHDLRRCEAGGEFWLSRPLDDYFLLAAAQESIYLLELSHILQVGLELSVRRATEIIMRDTVSLTDQEETQQIIVPAEMENI